MLRSLCIMRMMIFSFAFAISGRACIATCPCCCSFQSLCLSAIPHILYWKSQILVSWMEHTRGSCLEACSVWNLNYHAKTPKNYLYWRGCKRSGLIAFWYFLSFGCTRRTGSHLLHSSDLRDPYRLAVSTGWMARVDLCWNVAWVCSFRRSSRRCGIRWVKKPAIRLWALQNQRPLYIHRRAGSRLW